MAPAGYGKSTLARQHVERRTERPGDGRPAAGWCDCTAIGTPLEFCQRILTALADEDPSRAPGLAQLSLLVAASPSAAGQLDLALEAWATPCDDAIFVFDNAEHLDARPALLEVLGRLLAERPRRRTILICSRAPLRISLTRFAAPHEIAVMCADDLAFDRDELERVFAEAGVSGSPAQRAAELSRGWPIAALLLARFARERRLDALLDRLDDVAFEELHQYLAEHVLGSLSPPAYDALVACAAIPSPRPEDIALALGEKAGVVLRELASVPFLRTIQPDVYDLHPLVRATLLARESGRVDALLRAAAGGWRNRGDPLRTAQMLLAADDREGAAAALHEIDIVAERTPSLAYMQVLAALDDEIVARYPRLWSTTILMRRYCVDAAALFEEVERQWVTQRLGLPPQLLFYLHCFRIAMGIDAGRLEETRAVAEAYLREYRVPEFPLTVDQAAAASFPWIFDILLGRLTGHEETLAHCLPLTEDSDILSLTRLTLRASFVERPLAQRDSERAVLAEALRRARSSGLYNHIALVLAEIITGAWLAGEDDTVLEHLPQLDACVSQQGVHGFSFLLACASGRIDAQPCRAETPYWRTWGHLMACAQSATREQAVDHAQAALAEAERSNIPFVRLLARIALAEIAPERQPMLAVAVLTDARRIESPALHAAGEAWRSREQTQHALSPFVQRFRELRERAGGVELSVELFAGRVQIAGRAVPLRGRELQLMLAVARQPRPIATGDLIDLLWPHLDSAAAQNTLNVTFHRLRRALGTERAILRTPNGLRLCAGARVDLWDVEALLERLRGAPTDLLPQHREELRRIMQLLRTGRPNALLHWEWFEPSERRICELGREVAERLALDALRRGATDEALEAARTMIGYDSCDEVARELAIRALLVAGNRAGALRELRNYRETLARELQTTPSSALLALVQQDVGPGDEIRTALQ